MRRPEHAGGPRVSRPAVPLRRRLNLSRVALAWPRATLAVWLLITVSGLLAAWRLPVALFPDIVFPVIVVAIEAPGQPAAAVERALAVPVEARLLPLHDRSALTATTAPGRVLVTVPFDVGISLEAAETRVRAALTPLALPPGPHVVIQRVDLNESPIVTYAVTRADGETAPAAISVAVERLALRLAAVPGVARVVPLGLDSPDPDRQPTRVRLDGVPSAALEVVKQAHANTLEVDKALDRVVRDVQAAGPLRIAAVRAEAPFIREATGATLEALWMAVVLSVLVIHPFLRSTAATAISALAIPTSLVGTFLVMALAGFKFETITLLALALVIGVIVDDAIVDVENIVRHLPHADHPETAVMRATDEIGLTVTAATLTIAAVFVPVGLMGGVVGTFFRPFGLTISAAVLTSLLVARTLTPVLAVLWLRTGKPRPPSAAWQRFSEVYRRLLGMALRHPRWVLAAATASFVGGLTLIPMIPQGFIPALDRGECEVHYALPPGSGLEASDAAAARLAQLAASDSDIARVFSVAGAAGNADGGSLHVTLRAGRKSPTHAVEARLRRAFARQTYARVSVENVPIIAVAAQKPLELILTSDDGRALPVAASTVLRQIAAWPGVADGALAGLGPDGDGTWLRRDGRPAAVIRANLAGGAALGAVSDRAASELPRALPPGVRLVLAGESAQAAEVLGRFATALGLAIGGVLVVLLVLFRSWQDPVSIAMSLPLSAVGAMLGLFVARSDFGIVSLLGLVFLVGLVNKNAIILVDRINQLRATGLSRDEAILEAGPVRLRPIVMTTAAAVLGMLPIAAGLGAGAELRAPMAVAIIGGLVTSTLLSLIVVPVIYQLLDRLQPRFRRAAADTRPRSER
jgi:multidrug efflux pump subunit AcrB